MADNNCSCDVTASGLYLWEFRAVARSVIVFFVKQSLQKDIKLVTLNGKMVYRKF